MSEEAFSSLRLTEDQLQAILERLDESARMGQSHSQRRTRRWPLRVDRTVLSIPAGANRMNHLIVVPRNLSVEGIAVLHGGYLHVSTACFVTLRNTEGRAMTLAATIVRCHHIERHLHEIGIRFEAPIDPQQFNVVSEGGDVFNADHVSPSDLAGTVLVIGDREFQTQIKGAFEDAELDFVFACDSDAVEGLLEEQPHLIYLQDPGLGADAAGAVREIAQLTHAPLLVVASRFSESERQRLLQDGARELIAWPCERETLLRSAAEYLLLSDLLEMAEKIDDRLPQMEIERMRTIDDVAELGEEITNAMLDSHPGEVVKLAQQLADHAARLGDPVLARRARQAAAAVSEHDRVAPDELGLLVRTCRQIKDQLDQERAGDAAA